MTPSHLLYLHGFRSSPQSTKARKVAAWLRVHRPDVHWWCPQLPASPREAMALAFAEIDRWPREAFAVIGSSLGGFYATYAAEQRGARAVLVNPAVRPYDDLAAYRGWQENLYTGERFEVLDEHFDELRALAVPRITRPSRYLLLAQAGDEVLDYRQALRFYAGAFQHVEGGGDHAFAGFARMLPLILRFCGAGGAART